MFSVVFERQGIGSREVNGLPDVCFRPFARNQQQVHATTWHALHAVDKYLSGQAAWLVNYAKRYRAGERVGTSITEAQQISWSTGG
jgi:hypothetical protein